MVTHSTCTCAQTGSKTAIHAPGSVGRGPQCCTSGDPNTSPGQAANSQSGPTLPTYEPSGHILASIVQATSGGISSVTLGGSGAGVGTSSSVSGVGSGESSGKGTCSVDCSPAVIESWSATPRSRNCQKTAIIMKTMISPKMNSRYLLIRKIINRSVRSVTYPSHSRAAG